jgi:hypothetical protein
LRGHTECAWLISRQVENLKWGEWGVCEVWWMVVVVQAWNGEIQQGRGF